MKNNTPHFHFSLLWLLAMTFILACQQPQESSDPLPPAEVLPPPVDLNAELAELTKLLEREQEAHLTEQPALLVNMLNDTLCQIKEGVVSYYTKDQMTDRLVKYFYSVEFVKWEDISPPVISISPDGQMAHVLITKEVEVIVADQTKPTREKTEFAWTELWKKKNEKWKLYTVTTTDKGPL